MATISAITIATTTTDTAISASVPTLARVLILSVSTSTNYHHNFYNGHSNKYYHLRFADVGLWLPQLHTLVAGMAEVCVCV